MLAFSGKMPGRIDRDLRWLAAIVAIVALGATTIALAYWPGVMIDDARWQYQQSVDNAYEDWHPPLMAWIWHQLMPLEHGPAPMLVLQLLLFWSGIGLIALWLYRERSPRAGLAAAVAGWLPASFALLGSVTKDCVMDGMLCLALGLALWSSTARTRFQRGALIAATLIALPLAAALRANAFLACVPLALGVLPRSVTRTVPRFALATLASTAVFLLAPGAVASALHAEDTDVQLSLIIFDLGGITEHTGISQFPDLGVRNPVAANHRCYDPYQWDGYSSWAKTPCPVGFDRFQSLIDEGDTDARKLWVKAILAHPIAYAQHRLAHFNLSSWFLVSDGPPHTAWTQSVDNPWGYRVAPNGLLDAVDSVTNGAAKTPIGWPIFWISVALAAVLVWWFASLSSMSGAVAASALLYGIGYLVFGVATGMRYYMWTMTGAALAAILVTAEMSRTGSRDRKYLARAAAIPALTAGTAALARLVL